MTFFSFETRIPSTPLLRPIACATGGCSRPLFPGLYFSILRDSSQFLPKSFLNIYLNLKTIKKHNQIIKCGKWKHIDKKTMKRLNKINGKRMCKNHLLMVIGLLSLKSLKKICTTCLTGKQHKNPIPNKSLWRASKHLQLVHSDICGPIRTPSNSDKRYILSFIDDFTRKT